MGYLIRCLKKIDILYRFSSSNNIKGKQLEGRSCYMDFAATTPLDFRVLDSMMPYLTGKFGNCHSRSHMFGWETEKAVETARKQIADLIGADSKDIFFTSGATEGNNMSLKGLANFYKSKKKHFITTQFEHKCVLDTLRHLETEGFEVTYLPIKKSGRIDLEELERSIKDTTLAVSIMSVNNELGVIQDLEQIGRICRTKGVFFHTDAAQAFGKIPLNVDDMNIDLLSISGHKIYGPKGIGALYIRRRPRVRLTPLFNGGGQERGIRSGTVPTYLAIGLGEASRIAMEDMKYDSAHVSKLSNIFIEGLKKIDHYVINCDRDLCYPGIINVSFRFVEGESVIMGLKNFSISSGSACTSSSLEPSYVLRSIGTDDDLAHSSIRFSIGRFTTEEEIKLCLEMLEDRIKVLRNISPLWEFYQEGIGKETIQWTGGSGSQNK